MSLIFEHLELILFFGLITLCVHWIALKKGFLSFLPSKDEDTEAFPTFFQLFVLFAMYLIGTYLIIDFLEYIYRPLSLASMSWIRLILIGATLLIFFWKRPVVVKKIWKRDSLTHRTSILYDFGLGILTWLLAFPAVIFIGQISDLFLYLVFNVILYEQVAVRFLKMHLQSPSMLTVALFSILIAAPIIEEFLFRGLLQNWFKKFFGKRAAIPLAALFFALFHLAPSQGVGNISLFVSLFTLACYLGFIYERQGSLCASIGLHMSFNFVSTLRILFGG
jgi:membrane protease YdiL (CAAX protease family)